MALSKANVKNGNFAPHFGVFPALDGYRVTIHYQIEDDLDGTVINLSKDIDIWPLLTANQQNTLQTLTTAVINLAVARA